VRGLLFASRVRPRGYILSTACSASPRVPPENLRALRDATERFGTYA